MAINKVICNSSTLIDLTEDTVTADTLGYGITAHDKTGNIITGIAALRINPLYFDFNKGYVDNGTWKYENPTNTYVDIYEVRAGNQYFYTLGSNVGTRFRSMFITEDVTLITSGNRAGTKLINTNNPASYANGTFSCAEDGYLIIAKDNIGKTGVYTYVYNMTLAWV